MTWMTKERGRDRIKANDMEDLREIAWKDELKRLKNWEERRYD